MALNIQTTNVPTVTRTGAGRKPKPLTQDETTIIAALKDLPEGKALTFDNPVAVAKDDKATKRAEERVAAGAREEGRKEAAQQISDLLSGVVKKA